MEDRKDIGTFVQETMEKGSKSPQASLWDRLDDSLEKRAKKRRRALWFWFGGASLLLLLVAGIWSVSNSSITSNNSIINTSSENDLDVNFPEKKPQELTLTTSETHENARWSPMGETENETAASKEITTKEPAAQAEDETVPTSGEKISEAKKSESIRKNSTEGVVVTTKHLYYNSDVDSTVVSTNKFKIDSLVQANKDAMASKDSISRARAADAIKLNKITKDSIQN